MKKYTVSYYDEEGNRNTATYLTDSEESASNAFYMEYICGEAEDGSDRDLEHTITEEDIDLSEDEEQIVRDYHSSNEADIANYAADYVDILKKYSIEPTQEDMQRARKSKKTQYDVQYNKANTKQCNFRLSRISQQKEIDIFESIPDKASFFVWALHEWQKKEEDKKKPFVPRHEIPDEEKLSMNEYLKVTTIPKAEPAETHTHSPEVNRDIMNRYLERVKAINEFEKNKKPE